MSDPPSTVERAYRMRVYPTRDQEQLLGRLVGATRFVWNWALERRSTAYRTDGTRLGWAALSREFTVLRQAEGTAWLAELPRQPFDQVLRDQERAFANFFAKRADYPRFRRRGDPTGMRFTLDQRRDQVSRGAGEDRWARIALAGLGSIKLRRTEGLVGRLRSVTFRREADRWFASITADGVQAPAAPEPVQEIIGVDVGLREIVVRSDGQRAVAPAALAGKLARLARYQRHYGRQRDAAARRQGLNLSKPLPKGSRLAVSKRMERTRDRIARLHAGVAAVRREQLHQVTTAIVRSATVVAIEDLAVKGMARSMGRRSFRRSVANAAPGELRRQLTYKAAWCGRVLHVVDRYYPSSQLCSACGERHRDLRLQDRRWTCSGCGAEHDRDVNAATNLEAHARRALIDSPAEAGATRMSRGSDARGEPGAVDVVQHSASPQHRRSTNRELTGRRSAPNSHGQRDGPAERARG
jgi:putative transposase